MVLLGDRPCLDDSWLQCCDARWASLKTKEEDGRKYALGNCEPSEWVMAGDNEISCGQYSCVS